MSPLVGPLLAIDLSVRTHWVGSPEWTTPTLRRLSYCVRVTALRKHSGDAYQEERVERIDCQGGWLQWIANSSDTPSSLIDDILKDQWEGPILACRRTS